MAVKSRYALITVDTEALPRRASEEHVKRLIWGEHHNGTAGIREMCSIIDEVRAKMVFFVDICAALKHEAEIRDVILWLAQKGQDVQLHTHSEYLPAAFWKKHNIGLQPRLLNQCGHKKAAFVIGHFSKMLSSITGEPVRAYRAGSFRWNADTLRALKDAAIPLSFNNCMAAFSQDHCPYSEPSNSPYLWSNGIIEVPMTERQFFPFFGKEWWGHLRFPASDVLINPAWHVLSPYINRRGPEVLVLLLHSWSLLHWDKSGHAVYKGARRIRELRRIVKRLAKDYDIITTKDFLELYAQGKIAAAHEVDLSRAEMQALPVVKTPPEKLKGPPL